MKHDFYSAARKQTDKVKVFKFYREFTPLEVSILMFLHDRYGVFFGTYTDITRLMKLDDSNAPNIRKYIIRLAERGWVTIDTPETSHTKHAKEFRLSPEFGKEFL